MLMGSLRYRILELQLQQLTLSKNKFGVMKPTVLHEVEPHRDVRFYAEFYK